MLTKMTIKCSGKYPEPSETVVFQMTDGTYREIKFDKVSVQTENVTKIEFKCETPVDFKPWRISTLVTSIPGVGRYDAINFTTERYFVVLTDEMIARLNQEISEVA